MLSTDLSAKLEPRLERCGAALALCACLLAPANSWAQAPAASSTEQASSTARADAAFDEGRELFEQGRFKEACEKFELSQQLDPSPGTLLNLGNCYEPQGDLLRALATFELALEGAQRTSDRKRRQVWSDAASERVESLGKRIPRLTVDGAEPGSRVLLDGQPFEQLGQEVRQNPGRHQLEVSAPGKRPFSKAFELPEGQRVNIQLPPLAAEPGAPALESTPQPAPAPPPAESPSSASRFGVWPWVAGGTGAALLGTSLVTGLMASSKASQLEKECGDAQQCDPSLESVRDSARTLAMTTDVLWISGALILGAGVTLFVIDQSSGDSTALEAGCFDMGCGLRTTGSF